MDKFFTIRSLAGLLALIPCTASSQSSIVLTPYNQPFSTGCIDTGGVNYSGTSDHLRMDMNYGFMSFDASLIPTNATILSAEFSFALKCYSTSFIETEEEFGEIKLLSKDPRHGKITRNDIMQAPKGGLVEWNIPNPLLNLPLKAALDTDGVAWLQSKIGSSLIIGIYPPQNTFDERCIIGYNQEFGKAKPQLTVYYKTEDEDTHKPTPDFYADKQNFYLGDTVHFYDNSGYKPTGWKWKFGDGAGAASKNPLYAYADTGMYSVKLIVSNAHGSDSITKTAYIHVTPRPPFPKADFLADQLAVRVGDSIHFTDLSVNAPFAWYWDFDAESSPGFLTATAQNPVIAYSDTGWHSVSLVIQNLYGYDTLIRKKYIHVTEGFPPSVGFTCTISGLYVQYWDQSLYDPSVWEWNFGDTANPGTNTSNLQHPVHTYDSIAIYYVCLTAENEFGSASYCRYVNLDTTAVGIAVQRLEKFSELYPNPATAQATLKISGKAVFPLQAVLYDSSGKAVRSYSIKKALSTLDLSGLPPGGYVLTLHGQNVSLKLMVN